MTENQRHIAIIGAGFAGLSAAWDLAKAGYKVSIFEASAWFGGSLEDAHLVPGFSQVPGGAKASKCKQTTVLMKERKTNY